MNINKAKVGFFTAKVEIGDFFADKTVEDFESEEAYNEYVQDLVGEAWVRLKEATVEQTMRLQEMAVSADDTLLSKMDGDALLKYYEGKSKNEINAIKVIAEIVKANIVDHNFTIDDDGVKKAKNEDVGTLVTSNAQLMMFVFTKWQEAVGKLRRRKPGILDTAQE